MRCFGEQLISNSVQGVCLGLGINFSVELDEFVDVVEGLGDAIDE